MYGGERGTARLSAIGLLAALVVSVGACAPEGAPEPLPIRSGSTEAPVPPLEPTAGGPIQVAGPIEAGPAESWEEAPAEAVADGRANAAGTSLAQEISVRDTAVFAGGCFWCMEPPYDELVGVFSTTSGYAGGDVPNPTYEQVSSGETGHREVVRVVYDPEQVGYETLLDVFWRNVDPLDDGGQFCDRGFQYTTAIYAVDPEQERLAKASRRQVTRRFDAPVVTPVETGASFYPAEEYHQNYYEKNSIRYKFYRWRCGRDDRLEELWGDEAGGSRTS